MNKLTSNLDQAELLELGSTNNVNPEYFNERMGLNEEQPEWTNYSVWLYVGKPQLLLPQRTKTR